METQKMLDKIIGTERFTKSGCIHSGPKGLAFAILARAVYDYIILRNLGIIENFKINKAKLLFDKLGDEFKRYLLDYKTVADVEGLIYFFTSGDYKDLIYAAGINIDPDVIIRAINENTNVNLEEIEVLAE